MKTRFVLFFAILVLTSVSFVSCGKKPPEKLIVGPWRMAEGDTVYTFRKNNGWIALKDRDAEAGDEKSGKKEKTEGEWVIEIPEGSRKQFLIITPSEVEEGSSWTKDQAVKFELISLDLKELVIKKEDGDVEKWLKIGKHMEKNEPDSVGGLIHIPFEPVVVNLKRTRENEPLRYLCMNISLTFKNSDGLEYLKHIVDRESKKETYHIHPRINDVSLMFLSSLSYNDVKTLDRVREILGQYKKLLEPYFDGRLLYLNLSRVVVTPKVKSAIEFKEDIPPEEVDINADAATSEEKNPE